MENKSAPGLFREVPFLKKKLWSGELREDGYLAQTVGDRMTSSIIQRYIQNRKGITHGPAQLDLKLAKDAPLLAGGSFTLVKLCN
jgi:hypothetical protein